MLRSGGITKNQRLFTYKKKPKWYYEQKFLGHNYRMSDINASLGISQLKKINKFIKKRNEIAKIYNYNLNNTPVYLPKVKKGNLSSFHLYVIRLKKFSIKWSKWRNDQN